jgi:hypothetical protein
MNPGRIVVALPSDSVRPGSDPIIRLGQSHIATNPSVWCAAQISFPFWFVSPLEDVRCGVRKGRARHSRGPGIAQQHGMEGGLCTLVDRQFSSGQVRARGMPGAGKDTSRFLRPGME